MYMNVFIKRKERNWSQKKVAADLGISMDGYRKKEKGYNGWTLEEAQKLADLYKCSLDDLFGRESDVS